MLNTYFGVLLFINPVVHNLLTFIVIICFNIVIFSPTIWLVISVSEARFIFVYKFLFYVRMSFFFKHTAFFFILYPQLLGEAYRMCKSYIFSNRSFTRSQILNHVRKYKNSVFEINLVYGHQIIE